MFHNQPDYLNLYSNKFTGTIPHNLRWRRITFADLGRNQFRGKLPDDIGQRWVELRFLYLDHNQFTGEIPTSYPGAGNGRMEAMTFNNNMLTGNVPGKFWHNKLRKLFFKSIGCGSDQTGTKSCSLKILTFLLKNSSINHWTLFVPIVEFNVQDNQFTGIDKEICNQGVFWGGEMVEYKADCGNVCICDPWCETLCGE